MLSVSSSKPVPRQAPLPAVPEGGSGPGPRTPVALIVGAAVLIPVLLAYGLAVYNELQVVGVVLALLGLTVILARPFVGLIFFVALLYIRPEESIKALAGMHFTLVIALVTLLGMWVQLFLNREQAVSTPLNGLIIAFGVLATLSSVTGGDITTAATDFARLIVLVLLVLNLVRTPDRYKALVTAMLVFTGYLAAYSVYLFQTGAIVMDEGVMRSKGTGIFSDPNDLAATFAAGLALCLSRVIQTRSGARVCYVLIAVLLVYAIILTYSRGGLLAFLAVLGGFCFIFVRRKSVAIMMAVAAALLVLVLSPGRMTNFDSQEASANSRFVFWDNGVRQLMAHPLTGVGYNNFPDVNGGFVAHNSFVQCFAELGFPAYFCWMGCIYFCFRRRSPAADGEATSGGGGASQEGISRDLLGARLALIGYLTACFWITRTYSPVMYLLFTLPFCQQVAESGLSSPFPRTPQERLRDWGRIALLSLGSILFIFLLSQRLK